VGSTSSTGSLNLFVNLDGRPGRDLALESVLLDRASSGLVSLFLYSWSSPVVVLGYGQKVEDIDRDWCRQVGVPVFRRMTGGTGVVHRRDLAVSLFLPATHPWAEKITGLYELFLGALAPALEGAGGSGYTPAHPSEAGRTRSPICFEDQLSDTLVVEGRKVVGCAQSRKARAVLIHAAVSLNLAVEIYSAVFRVSEERILKGLGEAVPGGRASEVVPHVVDAFPKALGMGIRHQELPEPVDPEAKALDLSECPGIQTPSAGADDDD
jgi:lipoate-protein ligase A